MRIITIEIEFLRKVLEYSEDTGTLKWKTRGVDMFRDGTLHSAGHECNRWNSRYAGTEAGIARKTGRRVMRLSGRSFCVARVIWALKTGVWPLVDIEHRDLDPANNRWSNLRDATRSQNCANKRRYRNNKSGFKGVHLYRDGRYMAAFTFDGRKRHLGYYDTPEEAHAAYVKAATKHFGEFARAS